MTSKENNEYYEPELEVEEPFNPSPLPWVNVPKINAPMGVKNVPHFFLVHAEEYTETTDETYTIDLWFKPRMIHSFMNSATDDSQGISMIKDDGTIEQHNVTTTSTGWGVKYEYVAGSWTAPYAEIDSITDTSITISLYPSGSTVFVFQILW